LADLRIAVAGNQWITRYLIGALVQANRRPSLLINMGGHWAERISGYTDLAEDAKVIGSDIYRPLKYSLKSEEDKTALRAHEIDLLLVFGWQRLIPHWLLSASRLGGFGVHGGPEPPPRCRGRAVFNWAILLGYEHFYMYAFRLTPDVDNGEIVGTASFDILPADDILTVYHKNCVVSSRLLLNVVADAAGGAIKGTPQNESGATYLPKREPENGGIAWTAPARRIVDLVRALAPPYPGAFTEMDGERIAIHRAHVFDNQIAYDCSPGSITDVFPNGDFVVQAGDLPVYVREWSAERGFRPRAGTAFSLVSGVQLPDPIL